MAFPNFKHKRIKINGTKGTSHISTYLYIYKQYGSMSRAGIFCWGITDIITKFSYENFQGFFKYRVEFDNKLQNFGSLVGHKIFLLKIS